MTYHLGLIGQNINYSKSPIIHQTLANHLNIDVTYDLIDITPEALEEKINQLKTGKYQGFNITKPYKELVMDYCDILTEKAERILAVNTIYLKDGLVVGDNTDYDGFLGLLNRTPLDLKDKRVLILGTGGAAKACYHVLSDLGAEIKFVSRTPIRCDEYTIHYKEVKKLKTDIIVNATPVGTYPNVDESPLERLLVEHKTVIDLTYNPQKTKLMQDAAHGYNGLDMLVIQAIKSMGLWTHKEIEITDALMTLLKEVV